MSARGIGVIGVGSIGLRMLAGMAAHADFEAVAIWDPDPAARSRACVAYPGTEAAESAQEVIRHPRADVVYVACPPSFHREHALAAIDSGKPILCEKPLGVDLHESRELVQRVERSGLPNAVNLVLAAARASQQLAQALRSGALGEAVRVDIQLHLPRWAARRYAEAPWLAQRAQGGFVREVTTHYMFLCQRLFGELRLESAHLEFPSDGTSAECFADVRLSAGAVPVTMTGSTLGAAPEANLLTVYGDLGSMRIDHLHTLQTAVDDQWRDAFPAPENPELDTYLRQLDNLAAMLDGREHTLADFRSAYAAQELIEAIISR